MPEFLTFSKFHSGEEAQELISLLEKSNIVYKIESERDPLDVIYTGPSLDPMVAVKIPQACFNEVNALLLEQAASELDDVNPDYYLFQFSNEELHDVWNDPNEWNHFDRALAKRILSDRGIQITEPVQAKGAPVFTPYNLGTSWLVLAYLLTIFLAFAGIFISLSTFLAYKTLADGEKVRLYDQATRRHARIIFVLAIARLIFDYVYFYIE